MGDFSFVSVEGAEMDSMERLLRQHRTEVFRFARSIATDGDCAEDLTQRAFLALLERNQNWSSQSEVRAFLFHVVRKRVLKAARRRATHTRLQTSAKESLYDSPDGPDDLLLKKRQVNERNEALKRAVDALPPRRRQALILTQIRRLSYQEVAEIMRLSPQTVANHVSLAMKDLKAALTNH